MSEYEAARKYLTDTYNQLVQSDPVYFENSEDRAAYLTAVINFKLAADKEISRLNDLLVNSKVAGMIDKQREEIATKDAELAACKKLCEIYFNIAAEAIGEEQVRALRDKAVKRAIG